MLIYFFKIIIKKVIKELLGNTKLKYKIKCKVVFFIKSAVIYHDSKLLF